MPRPQTIKTIYKCMLRDAKALQRIPNFRLRNSLQLELWGHGHTLHECTEEEIQNDRRSIRSFTQYLQHKEKGFRYEDVLTIDIKEIIRQAFKENIHLQNSEEISKKIDEAIVGLRELAEQLALAKCSSVTTTEGVRIEATSQYVDKFSRPKDNLHRFTYRITITNENKADSVQITGRQLIFESESGQRIVVPRNSPGVVGHTPILKPGQTFEYGSGVDLDAPKGWMAGCLHVHLHKHRGHTPQESINFDAFISKFHLLAPHKLP